MERAFLLIGLTSGSVQRRDSLNILMFSIQVDKFDRNQEQGVVEQVNEGLEDRGESHREPIYSP
jgi:hypothetical protein